MLPAAKQIGIKVLPTKCSPFLSVKGQRVNLNPRQQRFFSENDRYIKRLEGQVAVITASTDGIGFGIAKRLAQDGANVVISSRNQTNVDRAVKELSEQNFNVLGLKCHVSESEDRKRLFDETIRKYGKINILVSNAAVNPATSTVLDSDEKLWDKIFDVNLRSSYLLAKEALPHLRKEKNSNIVFVSSISGYNTFGFQNLGIYGVSKTALIALTKEISKDLGPEGIRVNCLAPGVVKTRFSKILYPDEKAKQDLLSKIPLQRFSEPHEMASIVSFLVSNDASYVTGETIVAAGGMENRL